MRKVVNRKVYDTEKATKVVHWSNRKPAGDFDKCKETLYVTDNGRYFLHGEGGPKTRWKSNVPTGGWGWGEDIVPMSKEDAMSWLGVHDLVSAIEEEFPEELEEA